MAVHRNEAVVKLPLQKRADFESKDVAERAPVSLAAANGHETVTRLLLGKGADLEAKNIFG